jgi:anti-anti-sigma factor
MALKITSYFKNGVAYVGLDGELDASVAGEFKSAVEQMASHQPHQLILDLAKLSFMASAGLRVLVFAKQKMGANVEIVLAGAHDAVMETITMTGFHHSVTLIDEYREAEFAMA